jgi:Transglycosylase SLT domain
VRAGAGAAVLLGVTAAVDSITELGIGPAPVTALADGSGTGGPAEPPPGAPSALLLDDAEPGTVAKAQTALIVDQAKATMRERARAHAAQVAAQARARRDAQQAAARMAAQRAQQARQAREVSRSPARDPRSAARALLAARGWTGQFGCLDALWQRESGWNPQAYNASSGAFGIPQALPGSKMASAGADWRTNPVTQIRWGLGYIASTYGTPCGAWGHSQAYGWY